MVSKSESTEMFCHTNEGSVMKVTDNTGINCDNSLLTGGDLGSERCPDESVSLCGRSSKAHAAGISLELLDMGEGREQSAGGEYLNISLELNDCASTSVVDGKAQSDARSDISEVELGLNRRGDRRGTTKENETSEERRTGSAERLRGVKEQEVQAALCHDQELAENDTRYMSVFSISRGTVHDQSGLPPGSYCPEVSAINDHPMSAKNDMISSKNEEFMNHLVLQRDELFHDFNSCVDSADLSALYRAKTSGTHAAKAPRVMTTPEISMEDADGARQRKRQYGDPNGETNECNKQGRLSVVPNLCDGDRNAMDTDCRLVAQYNNLYENENEAFLHDRFMYDSIKQGHASGQNNPYVNLPAISTGTCLYPTRPQNDAQCNSAYMDQQCAGKTNLQCDLDRQRFVQCSIAYAAQRSNLSECHDSFKPHHGVNVPQYRPMLVTDQTNQNLNHASGHLIGQPIPVVMEDYVCESGANGRPENLESVIQAFFRTPKPDLDFPKKLGLAMVQGDGQPPALYTPQPDIRPLPSYLHKQLLVMQESQNEYHTEPPHSLQPCPTPIPYSWLTPDNAVLSLPPNRLLSNSVLTRSADVPSAIVFHQFPERILDTAEDEINIQANCSRPAKKNRRRKNSAKICQLNNSYVDEKLILNASARTENAPENSHNSTILETVKNQENHDLGSLKVRLTNTDKEPDGLRGNLLSFSEQIGDGNIVNPAQKLLLSLGEDCGELYVDEANDGDTKEGSNDVDNDKGDGSDGDVGGQAEGDNAVESRERESHNQKERVRRARIRDATQLMRQLVPGLSNKTDKATVMEFAARYIYFLIGFVGRQHDKEFLLKYNPY